MVDPRKNKKRRQDEEQELNLIWLIIVFIFIITLPFYSDSYVMHIANMTDIGIIIAHGLNILMGYTGQVSLGHVAFVAVGAYTSAMRELDTTAIQRSYVVVDNHTAARTEAGDILIPIEQGDLTYDHVAGELGEVLLGSVAGRTGERQITLFKSVGLAMQDAVTAARVYARALATEAGQRVAI